MNVATKAPSRLIRVLVHSHQNSRGSPETDSRAARLRLATDMRLPPELCGDLRGARFRRAGSV